MKLKIQALLALALLAFSGISMAEVTIVDPYVRAIPPGQTISAAFLTLSNSGDSEVSLVKASSNIAKSVELHEHVHKDGMMQMRQVTKISVAGKGTTALKPGGFHIMLIGLNKAINPGDMIELSLEFNDGSKQTVKAEVKKIMMGMMNKKGAMNQKGMHGGMGKSMKMGKGMGMNPDMKAKMKNMKHANPMPNLMKVITKMGDQLNLDEKQNGELKKWREERMPKVNQLVETIVKLEADLHQAAIKNESLEKIDQLADGIMQNRIQLIRGKALCRENMKRILDDNQYKKVLELYAANFTK